MNLLYGLRKNASIRPHSIATRDERGSRTWSELSSRVYAAANVLRQLDGQVGDRFGLLMLNSPAYFELYYAAAASGCVVVPCNTRWTVDEVEGTLRDAGCKALFYDVHLASVALAAAARLPSITLCQVDGTVSSNGTVPYEAAIGEASREPIHEPQPEDLFGLFYTSGTTGGSKGVMLTHANILSNAYHVLVDMRVAQDWNWLHSAPMFHLADGALSFAVTIAGGTHCFVPHFEAASFLDAVSRFRVTSALLLPTMMNMILAHPELESADVTTLRHVLYGGSPMPLELLRRAWARLDCEVWQAYGLTESSPILTLLGPEEHRAAAGSTAAEALPAGRAVTGVELAIVEESGRFADPGGTGEIVARGANIMRGYWNRPEEIAATLKGGWLHTGDIGRLDDQGYLYVLDRKKEMIKSGGENVYTPEVEGILYAHPSVLEASVVGLPDPLWGERVAAFVVARSGMQLSQAEISQWCRERLAGFKCPRTIFVMDSLPKSGAGKIQKRRLIELAVHRGVDQMESTQ